MVLCATLIIAFSDYVRTMWSDLAMAACGFGIVEGSMMAGCRIMQTTPPPPGVAQCNHLTGLPVYELLAFAELAFLGFIVLWVWKTE